MVAQPYPPLLTGTDVEKEACRGY
uniref:Uncharacterized protein n=1 Tax=Arundo donax TaxID=35708 RepID=A0A0A8YBF4_ARUDO